MIVIPKYSNKTWGSVTGIIIDGKDNVSRPADGETPNRLWQEVLESGLLPSLADVPQPLSELKAIKLKAIDAKSQNFISMGFIFDGKRFSLSSSAQMNWNTLDQIRTDLTYPISISTIDDDEYKINDAAIMHMFSLTAMNTIKSILDSGRSLKLSVNSANSIKKLDSIVDSR